VLSHVELTGVKDIFLHNETRGSNNETVIIAGTKATHSARNNNTAQRWRNTEQGMIQYGAWMAQWWERSPPRPVRSRPDAICGLRFLLVLALLRGFFSGSPVFLPPQKNQHIQIPIRPGKRTCMKTTKADVASFLNIVTYLFILYIYTT